jgi:hypothetical protein
MQTFASLAPRTSTAAQDEILRFAAAAAAVDTDAPIDRGCLAWIARDVAHSVQTMRLHSYADAAPALALHSRVAVQGHNDAEIVSITTRYDGQPVYWVRDRYGVSRAMLASHLTAL